MKQRFLYLIIIGTLFLIPCLAQTKVARKFEEFDQSYFADAIARMDSLAVALVNEPNATAYIIVYSDSDDFPGSSHRYANRLRNYLVSRRIDGNRVVAVGGGLQEAQNTEVWIVPEGATPPVPAAVFLSGQIPANQLVKFDAYPIKLSSESEWDVWDGSYEDEAARLGRVAELLKKRTDLSLYIIARSQGVYVYKPVNNKLSDGKRKYSQVRSSKLSDPVGFDQKLANSEKKHLIKEFGVEGSRIKAIGNGYNSISEPAPEIISSDLLPLTSSYAARTIELWLVPANEPKTILTKILQR